MREAKKIRSVMRRNKPTPEPEPGEPTVDGVPINHPIAPTPATPPDKSTEKPSPAVLALQSEIVALVSGRSVIHARVDKAHAGLMTAQAKLQTAQGQFQRLEQEVQYRLGLISQLEGKTHVPPQQSFQSAPTGPNLYTMPSAGPDISSADANDMVNRAHAVRAAV